MVIGTVPYRNVCNASPHVNVVGVMGNEPFS